jgi:hypothetical protein
MKRALIDMRAHSEPINHAFQLLNDLCNSDLYEPGREEKVRTLGKMLVWLVETDLQTLREFIYTVAAADLSPQVDVRREMERCLVFSTAAIRHAVGSDPLLIIALRKLMRPYEGPSVKLYRGQLQGAPGLSWTPVLEIAVVYALWRSDQARAEGVDSAFVIYEVNVPADPIICRPLSVSPVTDIVAPEYLLDCSRLTTRPRRNSTYASYYNIKWEKPDALIKLMLGLATDRIKKQLAG